jgi:hypothetical protein
MAHEGPTPITSPLLKRITLLQLFVYNHMQFLVPAFLLAALAIAIPIIIHLFYFRRFKKVYFTNVRFLREIKDETASRSRLRNLLVLLARIAAILFLVAAFAQPFIPRGEEAVAGPKAVGIYIDNSFSMQAFSRDVSLLDMARAKATQIVNGYGVHDRFQILTNDASGRSQRLVDREEALSIIEDIRISPVSQSLDQVLQRQHHVLRKDEDLVAKQFLISDFQGRAEQTLAVSAPDMDITAVPLRAVREQNVSIDTAWFESPVLLLRQGARLVVKVSNHGQETLEQIRLSMRDQQQEKPVSVLTIPGGQAVFDTIVYTPQQSGWQSLSLHISDHPIQFDDDWFMAFEVLDRLQVLALHAGRPSPFLERGLSSIGALAVTLQDMSRIEYNRFQDFQLIIVQELPDVSSGLRSALEAYMAGGGNVLIFPPPQSAAGSSGYNTWFAASGVRQLATWRQDRWEVGQINASSAVFRDVFVNAGANLTLPVTTGQYELASASAMAEEKLLIYRNGMTALGRYTQGQGNLYLSAAPLSIDYSNLGQSGEIWVPMIYRMALSGQGMRPPAYTLGKDAEAGVRVPPSQRAEVLYRLRSGAIELIPSQRFAGAELRIGLREGISQAGVYQLLGESEETEAMLALNYDRAESEQQFFGIDELRRLGWDVLDEVARADLSLIIGEKERGVALWRLCVILALVFLMIEMLLLRFWKV